MSGGLRHVIKRGATHGTIIGIHNALGVLTHDASEMLAAGTFRNPSTPEEEGTRLALVELGYIKRKWSLFWELTEAGRAALRERE
uniref:hypothetical protein n=1 Tax=Brucella pseudintermedia TaxID=370111 RepID=UPI00158DC74E|nr:hypothetical protein [Brucella pseudintermedia]